MESISDNARVSILSSVERRVTAIEEMRNHLDTQEVRLSETLTELGEKILERLGALETLLPALPDAQPADRDYSSLRRNGLANDAELRFKLLKDWVAANSLSVVRRASKSWNLPQELIAAIPENLEAEAEVLEGAMLLVGTRGQPQQVALPIKNLDPSSQFIEWFDLSANGHADLPAVLVRSNGNLQLLQKGITNPG